MFQHIYLHSYSLLSVKETKLPNPDIIRIMKNMIYACLWIKRSFTSEFSTPLFETRVIDTASVGAISKLALLWIYTLEIQSGGMK